jgi:hypothetical protein
VSDRFFSTLETPLVAGRDFDDRDSPSAPVALIVNEAFVQQIFAGANPIGVTIRREGPRQQPADPMTIVGVVRNAKHGGFREEFPPIAYLAAAQAPTGTFLQFMIRTRRPLVELEPAVGRVIQAASPGALFHFHDFEEQARYTLRLDRLMATLCGFFAVLGALLASIGVYGVTSYSVARRTPEIGIRLAVGATRPEIQRLILREALAVVALGLAGGAALTLVASRIAEGLLYGLAPDDPATIAVAGGVLGTVALAASAVPALRAARLDPTRTLRSD